MTDEPVNCLECLHCEPYKVLIGLPDWHCLKYNQDMSIQTIGDHFSCKGFRKNLKKDLTLVEKNITVPKQRRLDE